MTIFVSHSSADGDRVRSLVQNVEATGNRVWLDQDLTGGEAWWTAILKQIRECSVFIFALSENALQSEACGLELSYARDLKRAILPVQIGDVHGYRDHPIFTYQAIDYRSPTATVGIALSRAIHERERDQEPLPDPLPPAPPAPYEYLLLLGTAIQGRALISPDDQAAIVRQLRQALRDERNESILDNVRSLLGLLRKRPEVTHMTVTDINSILDTPAAKPMPTPRPTAPSTPTSAATTAAIPAAGWYPDPAGGSHHRYWDGRHWAAVQQAPIPVASATTVTNSAQIGSIVAFVFAAAAGVIPVLGLVGVGFGIAAMARKEQLGRVSLIVSVVITVISFIIWSAINSG